MTGFQIGDRVRANSKIGSDKATFEVTEVAMDWDNSFILSSRGARFNSDDWDFRLVHRPISLPTEAGIYGFTNGAGMKLLLTTNGEWFWIDFTSQGLHGVVRGSKPLEESEVRKKFEEQDIVLNYGYRERS